jgi:hypothetical protein
LITARGQRKVLLPKVSLLNGLSSSVLGSSRFTQEFELADERVNRRVLGSGRNGNIASRLRARPVRVSQGVEVLRPHLAPVTG